MTSSKKLLGLDIGKKKVGLALSDESWLIATHYQTVLFTELEAKIQNMQTNLAALIIGLPLKMDGTKGSAAEEILECGANLQKNIKLPILYEDERLTSWEARQILKENGYKPPQIKELEHQVSAQLILQSFLNSGRAANTLGEF